MIGQAVHSILAADGTVTALVVKRIRPQQLTQGDDLPAITYEIKAIRAESLVGLTGLRSALVRVAMWTDGYADTQELADAVINAMTGASGTYNSTVVTGFILEDASDEYIPPDDGTGRGIMPVMADFRVFYKET